ncbi:MAG: hypothetical protein R2865_17865 [Deinococcales bacterium]
MQAVLVTNGPGELYTWVKPILAVIRQHYPAYRVIISLIPCQFASGDEARIAQSFGADGVSSVSEFVRLMSLGTLPPAFNRDIQGFVLSLGGNGAMAAQLAQKLDYPLYRYSFVPSKHKDFRKLFVHDEKAYQKALALGVRGDRLEHPGNLVADAVNLSQSLKPKVKPHILLMFGSRDIFAKYIIPLHVCPR